ncbi:MAG: O-antigen ligase family protein [Chloroflexi bacterium]|nr:O-antigen ligase family protein [Chloroflexota bacterium]
MTRKKQAIAGRAERRSREGRDAKTVERRGALDMMAEYAIYGIAALIPLAVISTREFLLYETPKVALLNIFTLIALLSWFNNMVRTGVVRFRRPPFMVPVLAYLAVYVLATVLSLSPVLSIFGIVDRSMGLIIMVNLVLLYVLVFNILTGREQQIRCLKAFVWGSTVVALLGVLQYFGVNPFDFLTYLKGQRVGSTLGNADYGTPVIVLALPLAVAFLLRKRYLYALSSVLLLLMLLFSLPIPKLTGEWVMNIRMDGEAITHGSREADARPGIAGVATTVATVAVERVEVRKGLWEAGLMAARDYPVLGTGPNTYRDVFTVYEPLYYVRYMPTFREDKAHNEYIEVAQSTGLAGLAAYLWMMGTVLLFLLLWLVRNRKSPDRFIVAAVAAGAGGYLAYTFLLFHTIAAYAVLWMLLGVVVGLCRGSGKERVVILKRLPTLMPYAALLSLIIVILVGSVAMRPVWADLALARARTINVTDERSGRVAVEWYRKAADWHPFEYSYLRNAAHALSNLGASLKKTPVTDPLFQEAFYYIDRAQRQEPRNATVYYNRALVSQRSGRSDEEVIADLNKAIELYPYYIAAYSMLGDVERGRKDFEKAIVFRQKALEITPNDDALLVEAGYDYLQAEKFSEAIELLEKGISAGNGSARTRFLLGGAYELSGNKPGAREAYGEALKVDANHVRAREGLQRVGR